MTQQKSSVTIKYSRPPLYDKQREAIFAPERYSWIVASTKAGKTAGCIAWLLEQAVNLGSDARGKSVWWVAPTISQAEIAYNRLKIALRKVKEANSNAEIFTSDDQKKRIKLLTGAELHFKTGEKPDNLYGDDVYGAVLDEASRMREESFHAIRSTLTKTEGKCRIIGNLKGRKNWFYKGCMRAKTQPNHAYFKIICWDAVDAGVLSREEIEDAQQTLPEHVFKELYLCEPADDGGNPFGIKHIEACVYRVDMPSDEPVVWGWDLARSIDWTVGIGLNKDGWVCRYERFQHDWRTTLNIITQETGSTPALIDATGVGSPVVEDIQRVCKKAEGFIFTSQSKQLLMEGLAMAIQGHLIRYPESDRLIVIQDELESFEYEYTRTGVRYAAVEGMHDDTVCALALAWRKFSEPRQNYRILSL